MHVAIIIDEERLAHEQAMVNRLCIGLIGESVQVTRVVPDMEPPDSVDEGERRIALATRLEAPMHVLPWMRGRRGRELALMLERQPPDVLYAVGRGSWELGMDLARAMDCPVLLDVSSPSQIDAVPTGRRAASIAGYIAPTRDIAHRLGQRVGMELVSLVPLGVAATVRRRTPNDGDVGDTREPALAVLGESRDIAAYRALLSGLSRVARERPGMHVIMELHGRHEHEIWRHAERLNLMSNVSSIADFSNYRSLLCGCDIMLVPERFGDLRSVMLEAMGVGAAAIVSGETPLELFVAGHTALFVRQADAEDWAQAVLRLTNDAAERRRLSEAGRRFVQVHHRSTDQVAGLLATLERTVSGGAIPFAAESTRRPSE